MITLEALAPVAATGMFSYAWLMIATPAVVAAILLLSGSILDRIGHWLAVAAVLFSFSIAVTPPCVVSPRRRVQPMCSNP